jgi:hypothetical protein
MDYSTLLPFLKLALGLLVLIFLFKVNRKKEEMSKKNVIILALLVPISVIVMILALVWPNEDIVLVRIIIFLAALFTLIFCGETLRFYGPARKALFNLLPHRKDKTEEYAIAAVWGGVMQILFGFGVGFMSLSIFIITVIAAIAALIQNKNKVRKITIMSSAGLFLVGIAILIRIIFNISLFTIFIISLS